MIYLTDINAIQLKEITKRALDELTLKKKDLESIYDKLINRDIYNNTTCRKASNVIRKITEEDIQDLKNKLKLLLKVINILNNYQNNVRELESIDSNITSEELEIKKEELKRQEKDIKMMLKKIKL